MPLKSLSDCLRNWLIHQQSNDYIDDYKVCLAKEELQNQAKEEELVLLCCKMDEAKE